MFDPAEPATTTQGAGRPTRIGSVDLPFQEVLALCWKVSLALAAIGLFWALVGWVLTTFVKLVFAT